MYRRTLGLLATTAILAGAGFATFKLDARGQKMARARAAQVSGTALAGARENLSARLREVEARAVAGASLNPVRALVAERVDDATLLDAFGTEAWWQAFREEFTVHALVEGSHRFDFTPDGVARPADLSALLSAAETRPLASSLLLAGGVPHLAAASAVDVPVVGQPGRALLVLARPLAAPELEAIARQARASLLLVDAQGQPLSRAGVAPLEAVPSLDAPLTGPRGEWALARAEVAPGLFLWARADTHVEAAQARGAARAIMVPVWLTALLASGVALWLGLRPQRDKATAEMLARRTQELAAVKAELELARVSLTGMPAIKDSMLPVAPRTRTEPSLSAPVPFGRYELLRQLGEGGMARVYLALARGTGGFERLFVIKRLHEPLARQSDAVKQFMDEARLGASLVHSNIVPVYDFGQVEGEYYMASEYILGRDLDAVLRRAFERDGYPLEPATVFFVAQEVLKAIGYAHTRTDSQGRPLGIVHRDVSPMNILASARGEVKLLDFGIAKSTERSTRTQAGLVKGNVNFISPEQARGLEVDGRADLFSLGLTLYWCLTGELLYDGNNDFDRLLCAAEGPSEAHWERIARLPQPAASILYRALQPHPADRFQSAEEFALALPPVSSEDVAGLGRTMLRLFGEELRAEAAYRKALSTVSGATASPLGQIHTG
ncbi:serine/threonine-protein kinase [Hyalangium rubrum]|uniref:Serine/threonine-protein kinase n=1 Tax=Hyalangium rubrum TaxID=3103134 RepID=A0ABU5HE01_9BACT|nr:serine/threonine-protein kinase [Hyalangium sp. s54d21]MDY7231496.1 serine/threonine-protein kinase [Hyalangium sp. s54d21]